MHLQYVPLRTSSFCMITRRYIRVKAFQALYAWFQNQTIKPLALQKNADTSCENIRELYALILLLFVELKINYELKLKKNKQKKLPTHQDLNPSMRFLENPFLLLINRNIPLKKITEEKKLSWSDHQGLIRQMLQQFLSTKEYEDYMRFPEPSLDDHREILLFFLQDIVATNQNVYAITDALNISWHDDISFVLELVNQTLSLVNLTNKPSFLLADGVFKNKDDRSFLHELMAGVLEHQAENAKRIKQLAENWEYERIALIDRIILQMGLTECMCFESIPLKVTINEYLDLAKTYSSEKSHVFINGILDKAIADLNKEGKIKKIGRGLLDQKIGG